MRLYVIENLTFDPEKNLKIEKTIFNTKLNDRLIIRFWHNTKSIITGKHQIIELEVNQSYCKCNNIKIFKRFSGGGTVYHDTGVFNVSFIKPVNKYFKSHYFFEESRYFTEILVKILKFITKIDFSIDERNGIFYKQFKVAGSAVATNKFNFLYHISFLIEANLKNLYNAIKWNVDYKGIRKTVQSKRSKVINIKEIYSDFEIEKFKKLIVFNFKNLLKIDKIYYIN